jgi:hypothetical protein
MDFTWLNLLQLAQQQQQVAAAVAEQQYASRNQ